MKDKFNLIKKYHSYFNLYLIFNGTSLTEPSKSRFPTLKINTEKGFFYLHSKYDPIKEAATLIKDFKSEKDDIIVVLGIGLGYHLFELLKKFPNNLFIVFEADNNIYREYFKAAEEPVIKNKNIVYLSGDNLPGLSDIISYFIYTKKIAGPGTSRIKIRIFKHTPSCRIHPDIYTRAEEALLDIASNYYSNILTEDNFKTTWARNIKKNKKYFNKSIKLNELKDKFKKKPMIIACAGPSLETNIEFIKKNAGKMVVVSVDTSLRYLIKNNIYPDYVLSLDAGYENMGDFKFLDIGNKVKLIYDIVSFPKIQQMFKKKYVTCTLKMVRDFFKGTWIEYHDQHTAEVIEEHGDFGGLQSGGSVATNALDLALFTGADPIYFVGLDLKYINYKTHCCGVYKEKYLLNRISRFYNYETLSFITVVTRKNIRKHEGNDVYHYDFILRKYQQWFDNAFSMIKHRKIIKI